MGTFPRLLAFAALCMVPCATSAQEPHPDALRLADGTLVLYYGGFDPRTGGTINLARCSDPGSS